MLSSESSESGGIAGGAAGRSSARSPSVAVRADVPAVIVPARLRGTPPASPRRAFALSALAVAFGGGCTLGPAPPRAASIHDFGLAPREPAGPVRINATIAVPGAVAPLWLDSTSIIYRLAYADGGQLRLYAHSRWAGPPAEMITARLRARLAAIAQPGLASSRDGVQSDYLVRVELDEFSQVFDAPERSRGVVRARATLIAGSRRATLAQRAFDSESPAPSADAAGAAAALAVAAQSLIDALVDWIAATVPSARG